MKTKVFLACVCVVILGFVSGQEKIVEICSLPNETGNCRARFTRYYYNQATTHCEEFIYGGCGGNLNNFETIFECRKTCGQTMPSETAGVVIPLM